MASADRPARNSRTAAVLGTLALFAYAALAAVQIAVLNPLAAAPGIGLGQIHTDLADAGETLGMWWLLMAAGPLIGILLLLRVWRDPASQSRRVYSVYLALLVLGAPAYFVASFGPGMALADAYLISGADHSPWALPLYVTSVVAGVSLAALFLHERHGSRASLRRTATMRS